MKIYEGFCIGGFTPGRSYKSDKPWLTVPEPLDIKAVDLGIVSIDKMTVRYMQYKFEEIKSTEYNSIGFWIPTDMHIMEALKLLMKTYKETHHK